MEKILPSSPVKPLSYYFILKSFQYSLLFLSTKTYPKDPRLSLQLIIKAWLAAKRSSPHTRIYWVRIHTRSAESRTHWEKRSRSVLRTFGECDKGVRTLYPILAAANHMTIPPPRIAKYALALSTPLRTPFFLLVSIWPSLCNVGSRFQFT